MFYTELPWCNFFFNNLDWCPVPCFCPLEALAASVAYFTIPRSLNVPTLAARCLLRPQPAVVPYQPEEELWARNGGLGYAPRVLLHAANLRHGTDNFTYLPKEGVLRGFFYRPLKIQRLRPGLNPRTWVSEASTLPLHHRSRCLGVNKNGRNLYKAILVKITVLCNATPFFR